MRRGEDPDARRVLAAPLLVKQRAVAGVADPPLGADLHVLVGIVRPDADVPLLTGVEEEVPEHPAAARRRGAQQLDLGVAAVVDSDGARLLAERRAQEVHDRVAALESVLAGPVVYGRVGCEPRGELVPAFLA